MTDMRLRNGGKPSLGLSIQTSTGKVSLHTCVPGQLLPAEDLVLQECWPRSIREFHLFTGQKFRLGYEILQFIFVLGRCWATLGLCTC